MFFTTLNFKTTVFFSTGVRACIFFCALFFVDRGTKIAALYFFSADPYPIVPGLLRFSLNAHTKNFFIFDQWILSLVGAALLAVLCAALFFFERGKEKLSPFWIAAIAAGASGNILDGIRYGSIINWIEIPSVTFFNIADLALIGGCMGLAAVFFSRQSRK